MDQLAIISWNENGFWQADLFCDPPADSKAWGLISPMPDAFFTCARNEGPNEALAKAKIKWPAAKLETVYPDHYDQDE